MAGWQQLFWDNALVSQIDATQGQDAAFHHQFVLMSGEAELRCEVKGSYIGSHLSFAIIA